GGLAGTGVGSDSLPGALGDHPQPVGGGRTNGYPAGIDWPGTGSLVCLFRLLLDCAAGGGHAAGGRPGSGGAPEPTPERRVGAWYWHRGDVRVVVYRDRAGTGGGDWSGALVYPSVCDSFAGYDAGQHHDRGQPGPGPPE